MFSERKLCYTLTAIIFAPYCICYLTKLGVLQRGKKRYVYSEYSNDTPMLLHWYFTDTPSVLPWYFTDTPIVFQRYFNVFWSIEVSLFPPCCLRCFSFKVVLWTNRLPPFKLNILCIYRFISVLFL